MSSALPFALMGVAFWSGVFYLAFRFVRARERLAVGSRDLEELRARVGRLEEELGSTAERIERLDEAQEFTTKLLGERSGALPRVPNDRPG